LFYILVTLGMQPPLKHVCHSVGQDLTTQLVHAFVLSRLDYGQWQFNLGRSAQVNDRPSTTRTERSYASHTWASSTWPCDPGLASTGV